uniref:Uncharacterized protein n=1 Tax=Arundo donax TaxID=35708 RepID=A0A0A9BD58_ARUDO
MNALVSIIFLLPVGSMLLQERRDGDEVAAAKLRTAEPHGKRRSKVADSGAYAARKACFTVPKAVDDDLYRVPPNMLYEKPARKGGWLRILLMAVCFCPRGMP